MSRFASLLAEDFDAFLEFKRSRGCKYARAEEWLRAFDKFVSEHARQPRDLRLDVLIPAWLGRNAGRMPVTVANELIVIRKFCEFRQRRDPNAFVPTRQWAPQSSESEFKPYILTDAEIGRVLHLAAALDRPRFRAALYRALLLVLFCTGIRIGEALRLRVRDLDLARGVLFIAESKGRARWVPFRRSLGRELRAYLEARRGDAPAAGDDRLFVGVDGEGLAFPTASNTVRTLFRRAGIKPGTGRVGPRIHEYADLFVMPILPKASYSERFQRWGWSA